MHLLGLDRLALRKFLSLLRQDIDGQSIAIFSRFAELALSLQLLEQFLHVSRRKLSLHDLYLPFSMWAAMRARLFVMRKRTVIGTARMPTSLRF